MISRARSFLRAQVSGDIMNCQQAIEYIHSLLKFGIKPGLERIAALCEALGNPQDKLKFVHVAGTNGKGSTSTMIANILIQSGFSVGLYTSPYVTDFRERIMFNGSMIEKDDLAFCVEKVKSAADSLNGIEITEFEFLTAVAFVYYEIKKCDFVVLEVGLGGRFDATNVIKAPLVSVITAISLDHTAILGDTVEQIAFEKCGIIKEKGLAVTYIRQDEKALRVIADTCKSKNVPLIKPDESLLKIFGETLEGTYAEYDSVSFLLSLAGKHMVYNACSAIEAINALKNCGIAISKNAVKKGIESSVMPARCELISKDPIIILDGGHNEDCANALSAFIEKHLQNKKIVMLSSMMADKDYEAYLSIVARFAEKFIATKADVPRALASAELAGCAAKFCPETEWIENPGDAAEYARKYVDENTALVVCGSFYLAGEVRDLLLSF